MSEHSGARVVVADDDHDIRDLVVFKLEQAGYAVQAVDDGEAALAAISNDPPQLAILDVMMPGMSGIDVLRRLREEPVTREVPIILLTAKSREADVDAGFATGADDYVIKPFSPRELLHRVNLILSRTRA